MPPRILRQVDLPLDPALAEAFAAHEALPAEPGSSFGEAVGLAWAGRAAPEPVVLVAPAEELRASVSAALAELAVAERLAHLAVVALVDDEGARAAADDVAQALTLCGFATQTLGSAQIAAGLRRAAAWGRPALLVCSTDGRCAVPPPPARFVPPPMDARALLPVAFEGRARDVGAFALGIALEGRHAPVAVLPLAEADGMKPALRAAARHRLPILTYVTEDAPPADALWSLRLCAGVDVWRPADIDEAAAIACAWLAEGGARVIALGPEPAPLATPVPSDLDLGAAIVAGADQPVVTLVATGSEVALAVAVQRALAAPARVVALPSVERFARLPDLMRRRLLGGGAVVVLEAGVELPWRALFGAGATVVADPDALTVEAVVARVTRVARAAYSAA